MSVNVLLLTSDVVLNKVHLGEKAHGRDVVSRWSNDDPIGSSRKVPVTPERAPRESARFAARDGHARSWGSLSLTSALGCADYTACIHAVSATRRLGRSLAEKPTTRAQFPGRKIDN